MHLVRKDSLREVSASKTDRLRFRLIAEEGRYDLLTIGGVALLIEHRVYAIRKILTNLSNRTRNHRRSGHQILPQFIRHPSSRLTIVP